MSESNILLYQLIVLLGLQLHFTKGDLEQLYETEDFFEGIEGKYMILLDCTNLYCQYAYWNDYILGNKILQNDTNKSLYAIACFLNWLELYLAMRILKDFSGFVIIIVRIIMKMYVFGIMLLILILALSNFIYVLDID